MKRRLKNAMETASQCFLVVPSDKQGLASGLINIRAQMLVVRSWNHTRAEPLITCQSMPLLSHYQKIALTELRTRRCTVSPSQELDHGDHIAMTKAG